MTLQNYKQFMQTEKSKTPRTDDCYERAQAIVEKHQRFDLRDGAEIDELDKECRKLETELTAECAHADRLAELLPLAFDDDLCNWDCTAINEVLTAHEARRKGGENTQPEPTPRDGVTTD